MVYSLKGIALAGWTPLANPAPGSVGLMLLLPDGTVMAASVDVDGNSNLIKSWYRLAPDSHGSYVNGTWTTLPQANDSRLWYSSAVLRDGRVFVAGGEYGTGGSKAELYDPVTNIWAQAAAPGAFLSDSVAKLLPDGRVLVAPASSNGTLIYDPATDAWSTGPAPITNGQQSIQNEVTWLKLPDESILTVPRNALTSQRFIPAQNAWVADDDMDVNLYSSVGSEIGGALLLPNGDALFIGGSNNTALYTPSGNANPGQWRAGPTLPLIPDSIGPNPNMVPAGAPDAGCAMMVNGKVLCSLSPLMYHVAADPPNKNIFPSPTSFAIYDPVANTFSVIPGPEGSPINGPSYQNIMLALPSGEVLYTSFGNQLYVYKPDEAPLPAGKPMITGLRPNAVGSWHLEGAGLNGISEGASYGDDAQMDTNFPLVRFTSGDQVLFGRSFNRSSTGVQLGNRVTSTDFVPPSQFDASGSTTWSLQVVTNGFVSDPVSFGWHPPVITSVSPACGVMTGGTSVTITGTALSGVQMLRFGSALLTEVQVVNDTTITAKVPAHAAGFVDLTLASQSGVGTLNGAFAYVEQASLTSPTITSITPNHGGTGGGTVITISGADFSTPTFVRIGGEPATSVVRIDSSTLQVTTPPHAAGLVNVELFTTGCGQAGGTFTYDAAPTITGLSPPCGSPAGGTLVTIKGNNFTNASAVTFDGVLADSFAVVDATTITATTPPHATKAFVDVAVTTAVGTITRSGLFAYAESVPIGSAWTEHMFIDEHKWSAVACSADGSKLVAAAMDGSIWNSPDFGVVWTKTYPESYHLWTSACSSNDGTRLAVADAEGQIYTTADSGENWHQRIVGPSQRWTQIACSADGVFLAAVEFSASATGSVWTSTDHGQSWTQRTSAGSRNWSCISVSADGQRLVAGCVGAINGSPAVGSLFVSSDAGVTWTESTGAGARRWETVALSADGTRIFAGAGFGDGATRSSNFGGAWNEVGEGPFGTNWSSLKGSSDGRTLICRNGSSWGVALSEDYGEHWQVILNGPPTHHWSDFALSADGHRAVAVSEGQSGNPDHGTIWMSQAIFSPVVASVSPGSGDISGGTSVTITGENFSAPAAVTFDNLPATNVVVVNATTITATTPPHAKGHVNVNVTTLAGCGTGTYIYGFPPEIAGITPPCGPVAGGTTVTITGKRFTDTTGVTFGGTAATNLTVINDSTLTVTTPSHAKGFVDVAITNGEGTGMSAGLFAYVLTAGTMDWVERTTSGVRGWSAITSSADGLKLAATDYGINGGTGHVWVSTDAGSTWQQRGFGEHWTKIASSADGTVLVATTAVEGAITNDGAKIYTSTNSGTTWVPHAPLPAHTWYSVACSADGTKMAAIGVVDPFTGYSVWLSADSGASWTKSSLPATSYWSDITISGDGSKLALAENYDNAIFDYGNLWTSSDFGATWTPHPSTGRRMWSAITSSSDGTKLAAAETGTVFDAGGKVWTSTDSGTTWTSQPSSPTGQWMRVASSSAGDKLIGLNSSKNFPFNYSVQTSVDSGVNWAYAVDDATFAVSGAPYFSAVATSANGTRLAATEANAHIWTSQQVIPPTITSITPNQGPVTGGTSVTITGTWFQTPATVMFGGVAASNIVVVDDTTITATTPAHVASVVNVEVATRHGCAASSFTFGNPNLRVEQPLGLSLATGNVVGFGSVDLGSNTSKTFTLRNSSSSSLTGLAFNVSGAQAAEFTASELGATTLAPGASTSFTITFAPSAAGARGAALSITSNQIAPFYLNLSGAGFVVMSEISVFDGNGINGPPRADNVGNAFFPVTTEGETNSRTFTIQNTGTTPLNGLALSITGDQPSSFSLSDLGTTSLAPGATATFTVTFSPTASGALMAVVNIASNDADENPFHISVGGTGVTAMPQILVIAGPVPFGAPIPHNSSFLFPSTATGSSAQRTFTIVSNSSSTLTNLATSLHGPNASRFSASSIPATLAPGSSATFTLTFLPNVVQDFSAALHVSAYATQNPFVLNLTGSGITPPPPTPGIYSWGAIPRVMRFCEK